MSERPKPPPLRPSPFIVADPFWGSPRCVVCGEPFYSDQEMVSARRWRLWRIWLNRYRHAFC